MFQLRYPTSVYSCSQFSAGFIVAHIEKIRCSDIILELTQHVGQQAQSAILSMLTYEVNLNMHKRHICLIK